MSVTGSLGKIRYLTMIFWILFSIVLRCMVSIRIGVTILLLKESIQS